MTTPPPPGSQPHRQRQVAESFGADAERYDRSRPRYPQALVDRIVAGSPGRAVLDVGIGTGIAARLFQAAGCTVLGVEPDERMAALARQHGAEVEVAAFEAWDPAGREFDAVIAGQAWHWVDPVAGAAKAARVLRPGGRLALFWNSFRPPPGLGEAFTAVLRRVLPDSPISRGLPGPDGYAVLCNRAADGMRQAGGFGEAEQWRFDWERGYTRDEWLDQQATFGGSGQLPPATLAQLVTGIGAAIDAVGGSFTMGFTTVAVSATRSAGLRPARRWPDAPLAWPPAIGGRPAGPVAILVMLNQPARSVKRDRGPCRPEGAGWQGQAGAQRGLTDMAFSGWGDEALEFYEGLEADNSKTYWTKMKAVYEEKVLGPMTELLDELGPEFGESKVFRPYRDVRFSKDKTLYKTHLGALLGSGYIQFSARGLAAGDGMYGMAPDQVGRYREAVAADRTGGELEQVIAGIEKQGIEVHGRDVLKTVPRGFPADHPRAGLLRYKGIVAWQEWPPEPWLETPEAKDRIAGFLRATQPLGEWLAAHVGPSTMDRPAR